MTSQCESPFNLTKKAGCIWMSVGTPQMTWIKAREHCKTMNADLASPESFNKFRKTIQKMSNNGSIYLYFYI